jgi:hypothetical protein
VDAAELAVGLRGGAVVALDSNVVYGRRLLHLADAVNRLRDGPLRLSIQLVIPALVHAEHLAQERRRRPDFDPAKVRAALTSKGFGVDGPHHIVAFGEEDAEGYGAWSQGLFPTRAAWEEAKRRRCFEMLGLPPAASNPRCSATVDWFIAAQAEARGWWLVPDDAGPEFQELRRRCSLGTLMAALEALERPL